MLFRAKRQLFSTVQSSTNFRIGIVNLYVNYTVTTLLTIIFNQFFIYIYNAITMNSASVTHRNIGLYLTYNDNKITVIHISTTQAPVQEHIMDEGKGK